MNDDPVRDAAVALADLVDLRERDFDQALTILQSVDADDLAHQETLITVSDAMRVLLDKLQDYRRAQAMEILHGPRRPRKIARPKRESRAKTTHGGGATPRDA